MIIKYFVFNLFCRTTLFDFCSLLSNYNTIILFVNDFFNFFENKLHISPSLYLNTAFVLNFINNGVTEMLFSIYIPYKRNPEFYQTNLCVEEGT